MVDDSLHQQLVHDALKGNVAAIDLFNALAWASQLIDDYWDADKPVAREDMLRVILVLTVDVPRNPFYRAVQDEVVSFIEDALCFWLQASDIEECACLASPSEAHAMLRISYITRSVITDLLIRLARLVGGRAHERAIAMKVRSLVYGGNEPFPEYVNEHLRARDGHAA